MLPSFEEPPFELVPAFELFPPLELVPPFELLPLLSASFESDPFEFLSELSFEFYPSLLLAAELLFLSPLSL